MAENNLPGTTPVGTGPQGSTGTGNSNPGQNNPARKIAGKFDTIEQAVEQGYTGLEKGFHEMSEKVNQLTNVVERLVVSDPAPGGYPGYAPVGQAGPYQGNPGGGYGQRYNPNYQPDPDYIDPTQFVVNPGAHLKQREDALIGRVANMVSSLVSNAMVVNEFKSHNPDLLRHEKLVQTFLREEDQRKPLAERMETAAKKTREYLATINPAAGQPPPPPGPGEYVPGPGGASYGAYGNGGPLPPGQVLPSGAVGAEEKELFDYISERNQQLAGHFGDVGQMQQVQGQDNKPGNR